MNDPKAREALIAEALGTNQKRILPFEPTFDDLKKYSKIRLRKSRSKKKFRKNLHKYLPRRIWLEYLSSAMVAPIRRALRYDSIGRKILHVEPIPESGYEIVPPLPECAKIKITNDLSIIHTS